MRILSLPVNFVKTTIGSTRSLLLAVVSVIAIMLAGSLLPITSAIGNKKPVKNNTTARRENKDNTKCSKCSEPSNQIIYLPLIDLPEAQGSELVFNSRSPKEKEVTPIFYKADGTAIVAESVLIKPTEMRYVDLKKLIPGKYREDKDWGGMSLTYNGVYREMWAQLSFLGVNNGGSVDEFFTVPIEVRSDLQEAVWWMPEQSTAIIALGNITDTATSATVGFGDGQTQTVSLAPHATEIIRYVPRSQAGSESIIINITGAAGSVIPTGLVTSPNGAFNKVIRFYETKMASQPHLFGNGLRLADSTPRMVLKNTSSATITAMPKFIPLSGIGENPVALPAIILEPRQMMEVDLGPLMDAAQRRADLETVGVEVVNSGTPGSLIGALYSSNNTTGINYDVPLRDSGPPRVMSGAYPWRISDDYTTIIYITNISDEPAKFVAQINFDGGKYVIDPRKLAAGETAVFDMREMIVEQKQDNSNRRLPKDVQIGQFRWREHGVTGGKTVLNGRAEMVSRIQQTSMSYSCADTCLVGVRAFFEPNLIDADVGEEQTLTGYIEYEYATGYVDGPYVEGVTSFSNYDANVVTMNGNIVRGVGAGQTSINAKMGPYAIYSFDEQGCFYDTEKFLNYPIPAKVHPKITGKNSIWYFNGEFPSDTTIYPTFTFLTAQDGKPSGTPRIWTVTQGSNIANFGGSTQLNNEMANPVTLNAADRSQTPNDVSVTVNVGGVTSRPFTVTVRVPYKLMPFNYPGTTSNIKDECDATHGYKTSLLFEIRDQFTIPLPAPIELNEFFTSQQNVWPGGNWTPTAAGGATSQFVQDIQTGALLDSNPPPIPVPICPQSPLRNTKVKVLTQEWYIGSTTPGRGRKVQIDTVNKYEDHARFDAIISPVN
jgi:hypothetical protein